MLRHGNKLKHEPSILRGLHPSDVVRAWFIQYPKEQMTVVGIAHIDQVAVTGFTGLSAPVSVPSRESSHLHQRNQMNMPQSVGLSANVRGAVGTIFAKKVALVLADGAFGFPVIKFRCKVACVFAYGDQLAANRVC